MCIVGGCLNRWSGGIRCDSSMESDLWVHPTIIDIIVYTDNTIHHHRIQISLFFQSFTPLLNVLSSILQTHSIFSPFLKQTKHGNTKETKVKNT